MISKKAVFALAKALEGLPVLGTLEGTPAARAGVRYGDILVQVNGMRTRTASDYVEAKNRRLDGMEVVVFRDGAHTTLDFAYDHLAQPIDPAKFLEVVGNLRLVPADEVEADADADPDDRERS